MKFVDSHKKQLDYAQILHTYHVNLDSKDERTKDFNVWMIALAGAIASQKMDGAIIGNTVFYYSRGKSNSPDMVMLWALNVDTMQNAVDNLIEMIHRLVEAGIQTVVSIYDSPAMSRILRQAAQKSNTPGDELVITKLSSGKYFAQFTIGGLENV
jgi:hypothetical protein